MQLKDAVEEIISELARATEKYGPFSTAHEGWAVIREEFDELWDEIKMSPALRSNVAMRKEAKQVAAMAIRFMVDIV